MLSSPTNRKCPYCNKYSIDKMIRNNPINYEIEEKFVCTSCSRQIDVDELYQTDSANSASSADKYCQNCNTKMEPFGDGSWWSCPKCGYGYMDYIGDPPQLSEEDAEKVQELFSSSFYIKDEESKFAVGKIDTEDLMSNTLQFDRCERIIFRDKTLDFVFEIPDEQYKNIDTIIVNGHKFVRESNEHQ